MHFLFIPSIVHQEKRLESNYLLILTFSALFTPSRHLPPLQQEKREEDREGEIRKNRAINKGKDEKRERERERQEEENACELIMLGGNENMGEGH